eukprot:COSAG04_NODE_5621_length_1548_cov_1.331953_2_plen_99_part_00
MLLLVLLLSLVLVLVLVLVLIHHTGSAAQVKSNIEGYAYSSIEPFCADMELIFANARKFNEPCSYAKAVEQAFSSAVAKARAEMAGGDADAAAKKQKV